jgi:flagellar biogenesis protein FliO
MESLVLIKALALIALLLALIYGCFIFAQKRMPRLNSPKRLGVLEYQRIDHKNSLCLVKADSQEFLIAMGPANIAIHPMTSRD